MVGWLNYMTPRIKEKDLKKKINQKNVNKKTTAQMYETDLAAVLYT